MFYSYPDIHETRRCPHGKLFDDYCEPCEEADKSEAESTPSEHRDPCNTRNTPD
jgi:hypothetical protein